MNATKTEEVKRNKLLLVACALLVLVMLSMSMVSGTYAKYTTTASGSDSARVAKWGVALSINANNFATEYATDDTSATSLTKSVIASTKVVAPGTDSAETGCQATFGITGSPEVATKVQISLTNEKDIYLKAGTYYDPTTADATDTFTLANDYYPVVWTLKQTETGTELASGKLSDIQTFLTTYNSTESMCTYAANQSLAANFTLDWAWAFNGNDAADTYLGNAIAGNANDPNASTSIGYDLSVTITQID